LNVEVSRLEACILVLFDGREEFGGLFGWSAAVAGTTHLGCGCSNRRPYLL
jgi:hypothetical protein